MKTLLSLLTLAAIAFIYVLSVSLYLQDAFFAAYSLIGVFVIALTFWIKSNDLLGMVDEKKA
jgi:hypothetical protein